jgi:hypothetical protein
MDMLPNELAIGSMCSSGTCNWIDISATAFKYERSITAITGNQITLDAPIPDSIDSSYVSGTVQAYTFPSRISQVGVEDLRAIAPVPANNLIAPSPTYQLVETFAVLNGWIRNLTGKDTLESIDIETYCKQITVSNVSITHTVTQTGSAKFEEYFVDQATQILMDNVSTAADNMILFATSSRTPGPNVLRNANFTGNLFIEPHQRWATGLLIENSTIGAISGSTQGTVVFGDRGSDGSGQGWAIGWGVVWNTTAGAFVIQQPPGSQNWCIGCIGQQQTAAAPGISNELPQGAIDSSGVYVFPASLYQAQLTARLGAGVTAE